MFRLITFLGNPGTQYARTRHNLPWMLLQQCSLFQDLSWQTKFHGRFSQVPGGPRVLQPDTFMNQSGKSVAAAVSFFNLEASELLVVHDEVELPFGTASLKAGGGAAGHNGIRSVVGLIGTGDFYRLRLGVSRPKRGSVSSYVLSRFSPEEEALLSDFLAGSCRLLGDLLDTDDPDSYTRKGKIQILPE